MNAESTVTNRATSSDQRNNSRKTTRARTLASTRTSSPNRAATTTASAARSIARWANGAAAAPVSAGSAPAIDPICVQSRLADTSPYAPPCSSCLIGRLREFLHFGMAFLRLCFLWRGHVFGRGSAFTQGDVAGDVVGLRRRMHDLVRVRRDERLSPEWRARRPLRSQPHFNDVRLDARHAARSGGEAPIAFDMNLDLLDQRPNSAIARGLGDRAVKGLVRLMEGVTVADALSSRWRCRWATSAMISLRRRPLGREPRRCLFQRLALTIASGSAASGMRATNVTDSENLHQALFGHLQLLADQSVILDRCSWPRPTLDRRRLGKMLSAADPHRSGPFGAAAVGLIGAAKGHVSRSALHVSPRRQSDSSAAF